MMKITALVPAYNEEKHLYSNLEVLTQIKELNEIIVISDGSTDRTVSITRSFPSVKLITNPVNLGKTASVLKGARAAKHPYLLLYDADLYGMRASYLKTLINAFYEGYDMVIMDKGGKGKWYRQFLRSTAAQSGTRLLKKKDLLAPSYDLTRSFDLEPKLNDYFLRKGKSITVTLAPHVNDPRKFIKYPFFQGLFFDFKSAISIIFTYGLLGIPKTFRVFHRISALKQD